MCFAPAPLVIIGLLFDNFEVKKLAVPKGCVAFLAIKPPNHVQWGSTFFQVHLKVNTGTAA
jgi:hypothetical protein